MHTISPPEHESWFDLPDDPLKNPCLNCGACCSHFRISFYQGELKSLGGYVPDELTIPITSHMMSMQGTEYGGGKCVALRGRVGQSVGCSIYANRPAACRSYAVWDEAGTPNPRCQTLREKIGLPPLLSQTLDDPAEKIKKEAIRFGTPILVPIVT